MCRFSGLFCLTIFFVVIVVVVVEQSQNDKNALDMPRLQGLCVLGHVQPTVAILVKSSVNLGTETIELQCWGEGRGRKSEQENDKIFFLKLNFFLKKFSLETKLIS